MVVDNRDERIISPFQNWLVEELCQMPWAQLMF